MQTNPSIYWPDWLTAVVAVVALIQPWLFALWKKFLRRPSIEVYETGNIEAGFSNFGSTIGLLGTFRAIHREVFVESATVTVVRKADKAETSMEWRASRSIALIADSTKPAAIDPPVGFLLTADAPRPFSFFFAADHFQATQRPLFDKVTQAWQDTVVTAVDQTTSSTGSAVSISDVLANPVSSRALYDVFTKKPEALELHTALNRVFFWHAGDYTLTLRIKASKPDVHFEKSWSFTLQKQDEESLRMNVLCVLEALCNQNTFYRFAYAPYRTP
jgi:hypothetical protein